MLVFLSQSWLWHGVCPRRLVTRDIFLVWVDAENPPLPFLAAMHSLCSLSVSLNALLPHYLLLNIISHRLRKDCRGLEPAIGITGRLCRVHRCWERYGLWTFLFPLLSLASGVRHCSACAGQSLVPGSLEIVIIRKQEREALTSVPYEHKTDKVRAVEPYVLCMCCLKA